jgi:hypothetical protein
VLSAPVHLLATQAWTNALWTGLLLAGIGALMALLALVTARTTDSPFVDRRTIGGFNGALGVSFLVIGVALAAVSLAVVLVS